MPDAIRPEAPMGTPDPLGRGPAPGETRRAIRYVGGSSDGHRHKARLEVRTPQAKFSAKGTVPHTIVPRGSGYPLRFVSRGVVVRTMRVSHPGNAGTNWWETLHRKHWPGQLKRAARTTPFV